MKKMAKGQIQAEADNQCCAVKKKQEQLSKGPVGRNRSSKKNSGSTERSTVADIRLVSSILSAFTGEIRSTLVRTCVAQLSDFVR